MYIGIVGIYMYLYMCLHMHVSGNVTCTHMHVFPRALIAFQVRQIMLHGAIRVGVSRVILK